MSYPYGTYPTQPIPPTPKSNRTIVLVLAVVAALLLSVLGVASVMMFTGAGKTQATPAPELVLESASSVSDAPFSPTVALTNRPLDPAVRNVVARGSATPLGQVVDGTAPGLYASSNEPPCDTAALANHLLSNPATARVWAGVFGITVDQIPYYLDTLTPVVLGNDTRVTNHTYSSRGANPFQSVLQAGTPVLIDAYGVPRVQCSCGNPLAPPASTPLAGYRTVNAPWPGYATRDVVSVNYHNHHTTVINNTTTVVAGPETVAPPQLTLIDLNTLVPFLRTAGGILDTTGLPPMAGTLPTPAQLNVPFTTDDPVLQDANGVQADGQPAENVLRQAQESTSTTESSATDTAAGPSESTSQATAGTTVESPAVVPPAPGASSSAAAPAPEAPVSAPPAAPAPSPTQFVGSGDVISSLSFSGAGAAVTCTADDLSASPVVLSCTDGLTRTVLSSNLQTSAVASATDSAGVWTVSLIGASGPQSVAVTSAMWVTTPTTTVAPPPTAQTSTAGPEPTVTAEPAPTETTTTTTTSSPAAG
ncbi:DUF6777 domain-containing protein [Williamsia sp. 1135]|uniref:DUF6777 domain-containing protein n=1 Tax=Williamsia sp. 1135 TaxID=1889262 RepID=UPI000A100F52|nr:DUF6777 domain-containing protein [Williamsia sp. 1135]ORM33387.1 hypothetical protein BFL43_13695 [Williamsia sp. 1135]